MAEGRAETAGERGWRATDRRLGLLLAALLAPGALAALAGWAWAEATPGAFSDMFAFWSFGRFIAAHPPALLYDHAALHAFQTRLGGGYDVDLPFLYPPAVLLLLRPLALLPLQAAFVALAGGTLALYAAALSAPGHRLCALAVVLAAPATLVCLRLGQLGFLLAALIVLGFALLPRRPWLAGLVLGLTVIKPQLAGLVPLALVAGGQWRSLAGAGFAAAELVVLSAAVFNWDVWRVWLHALPDLAATVRGLDIRLYYAMPTVAAGMRLLGADPRAASLAQGLAAALAAAIVWRVFRRPVDDRAVAILLVATLVATPYAMPADLTLLSAAVILVWRQRIATAGRFGLAELALLGAAFWMPGLIAPLATFPFKAVLPLAVLLWLGSREPWPRGMSLLQQPV